jgi:sugar fermentation stimulation protein A
MKYRNVRGGVFISRPNRFVAEVEIDGKREFVHVKNTGRCRELLIPGAAVYLQEAENPNRSTRYDLITVQKSERLINMDANAPNTAFHEYLQSGLHIEGITSIRPETKYGTSRFDFYVETKNRRIFIEVKGVTLEEDGVVMFPDAPTERGVKHLKGTCSVRQRWIRSAGCICCTNERGSVFYAQHQNAPGIWRSACFREKRRCYNSGV